MNNTTAEQKPKSPRDFYDMIYSQKAPAQHEWVAGTASPELVKLVWNGVLHEGMNVLEVGSGVGTESVFMAVRGINVTGVDLSSAAVELSKNLAKFYGVNVNFMQGDALNLDLPNACFDAVCDQGVFHHLKDEERKPYADSIARVLKPGGLFILRSFSDKIPGGPQPRRVRSDELTSTFLPYFNLEHLERVLSFSTKTREKPLGWFSIWIKK